MHKLPNPEMPDDDNPEWTDEMFAQAVRFEALPASLKAKLRRGRGPNRNPLKERISIRLSPEVLAHFRASGAGWQGRMDEVLKNWVATQPSP